MSATKVPGAGSFSVVMTLVERPVQLEWCLHHLRLIYPDIVVTVISDGNGYPEYPGICAEYHAQFVKGEKLKRAACGGRWWLRTLTHGLETGTDYMIKIDPDTKFQRRIGVWPSHDIFGTLTGRGKHWEHIQGGVQGFARSTVVRLIETEYFADSALCDPATYAWSSTLLEHARKSNYLCTDAMLRSAKRALKLSWGDWTEVCSRWRGLPADKSRYAITHPHKWQSSVRTLPDSAPSTATTPVHENKLLGAGDD